MFKNKCCNKKIIVLLLVYKKIIRELNTMVTKIILDLNNINDNGIDDFNIIKLGVVTLNDLKKIKYEDLIDIQCFCYRNLTGEGTDVRFISVEDFYKKLKSVKYKIKAIYQPLMSYKFDKLSELILLLRSLDFNYTRELYYNRDLEMAKELKIVPYNNSIEMY